MIRGRRVIAMGEVTHIKHFVLSFFILNALFLILTTSAFAQYGAYGGPGSSPTLLIDKLVNKPGTNVFVDNLAPADPRFAPLQDVFFKLVVKNTSDVKLNNVTVKDTFPEFVEFVTGSGSYDKESRVLSFSAGDFAPREEKSYILKVRVLPADKLPADKELICPVNKVRAESGDLSDEDSSQFCVEKIEKQVMGKVTEIPAAGPEGSLLFLSLNLLGLGAGLALSKFKK